MAEAENTRSILAAMSANLAIAVAKFIAAAISGSSAMLAEAVHSLADTGNQLLLLFGMRQARKPADTAHPIGHGRERYFWSFVVAISLFVVGAVFSILEGLHRLTAGGPSEKALIALLVLAVAAVFESISFTVAYRAFNDTRRGRPFFRSMMDTKEPAVITVLCEDMAALAGIAVAATGIILADITGHTAFDALASIGVGLLLALVAVFLGRESKSMLIGESASPENRRLIRRICRSNDNVREVGNLIAVHISPDDIMVNLNLRFARDLKTADIEKTITELEKAIHESVPQVHDIFIEPSS
jgi:cation diffusion facilitator family transporter